MKKENVEIVKNLSDSEGEKISRKEAIKKAGYIAVSAATMMILLNTNAEAHGSPECAPPPKFEPKNDPCGGGKRGPWK